LHLRGQNGSNGTIGDRSARRSHIITFAERSERRVKTIRDDHHGTPESSGTGIRKMARRNTRGSVATETPVDTTARDAKTGHTVGAANAYRTFGARVRRLGTYVAYEPYGSIGAYVLRFTFTGKYATGGFTAVRTALAAIGLESTEPETLPADNPLAVYSGAKNPVFTATLTGKSDSAFAGFVVTLTGSDNPETGLIPFVTLNTYPATAATAPKQSDKSGRAAVVISFPEPTVNG
jgi:hypothetical protein